MIEDGKASDRDYEGRATATAEWQPDGQHRCRQGARWISSKQIRQFPVTAIVADRVQLIDGRCWVLWWVKLVCRREFDWKISVQSAAGASHEQLEARRRAKLDFLRLES